jgi:hypothetical protein
MANWGESNVVIINSAGGAGAALCGNLEIPTTAGLESGAIEIERRDVPSVDLF